MILKKIRKTIEDTSMLERGDHILVAVSGGADSVTLLRVLVILSSEYRLHLTTAHLNHGLRGEESDREERFVRDLSAKMGIICVCKTVDIKALLKGKGRSLEEIGREERYRFLNETAETVGARKIATGHHRDDQAETVLINLIRGSGPEGLTGIAPVKDRRIIRPLFNVRRAEILSFLNSEGLPHMTDSSNLSSLFLRNRIRNNLIPELVGRYNPQIVPGLCHTAEVIRREDDYLKKKVMQIINTWEIDPAAKETVIPVEGFLDLHEALQGRIIKHLLESWTPSGNGIAFRHIEAVLELIRPSHRNRISLDLPHLICVEKKGGNLRITRVDKRQARGGRRREIILSPRYSYPVEIPGEVYLYEIERSVRLEFVEKPGLDHMKSIPWIGFMDYDRIAPPLIIRNVKPGDQIEPLGMAKKKKMKSYFIDIKIPYWCRMRIPLLVDSQSVLWIAGERISDRVKITEQTKKVLKVEMV